MDKIPRLLKTKDVCAALNVCRRTLYKLMDNDPRLAPVWIGRSMRWHADRVAAYAETGSIKQKPIRGKWHGQQEPI